MDGGSGRTHDSDRGAGSVSLVARCPETAPPAPVRGTPPGTVDSVRRSVSREGDADAVASDRQRRRDSGKRAHAEATRSGDGLGDRHPGGTAVIVLAR